MMYDVLVVGAGISGAVVSNLIAERLNKKVLVIDRREHIAGNCFDYKDYGITIHRYGAHIFHTNNKEVWDYISNFTRWNYYFHKLNVVIEGNKVTLPFNLKTLRELFSSAMAKRIEDKLLSRYEYNAKVPVLDFKNSDDKDLRFIADYIYENVFKNYTIKQWGLKPEEIDYAVTARVPICISNDDRYFQDKYQGIPMHGYTNLIKNILDHKNITVELNADFKELNASDFKHIFYTGAIDEYFNYRYGKLAYRSLKFDIQVYDKEYYQSKSVINYPNDYDFTRIIEHKYFLDEKSKKTVISIEYPEAFDLAKNERYYPVSNDENAAVYIKYLQEAKTICGVTFLGRLGDYKYYNMDMAVKRAINVFKEFVF